MIRRLLNSDMFKNRHYIQGLAFQKGMPFVIIPLIIWAFGINHYTEYVLIYSVVQIAALFQSLGSHASFIVFWYHEEDKQKYLAQQIYLLVALSLIISVPVAFIIYMASFFMANIHFGIESVLTILTYSFCYNLSMLGVSLMRSQLQSRAYFWITLLAGILLISLLFLSRFLSDRLALSFYSSLNCLIYINILVLLIQALLFIYVSKEKFSISLFSLSYFNSLDLSRFSKQILPYCIPVMLYTLLTLSVFTIDKIIIRFFYSQSIYNQYILDYQFAFVVNIFSIIIGMYNLPIFCQLIKACDMLGLKKNILSNYALAIFGSIFISIGIYIYAFLVNIDLSYGYWVLSGAFLVTNIFSINVSLMEAFRKANKLAFLTLIPTIGFFVCFVFFAKLNRIEVNYFLFMVYYVILSALSWAYLSKYNLFRILTIIKN